MKATRRRSDSSAAKRVWACPSRARRRQVGSQVGPLAYESRTDLGLRAGRGSSGARQLDREPSAAETSGREGRHDDETHDDPAAEVALHLRGLYEVQRDADRLPESAGVLHGFEPDARYCLICLRRYEPTAREGKGGRGGPPQWYCGPTCRARATDRRRRELPRDWRWCASFGGPFLALTLDCDRDRSGAVVCPPPWPAPPFGRSACAEAHRRETNRAAKARGAPVRPGRRFGLGRISLRDQEAVRQNVAGPSTSSRTRD